eukprot:scaffold198062_cov71-Attheya_sp.AAC.1
MKKKEVRGQGAPSKTRHEDMSVPDGGKKTKEKVQEVYTNDVFNHPEFHTDKGPLGSHHDRKLALTH